MRSAPRRCSLAAIMLAAALLALAQVNQQLILASDNSIYVVLGQALALGRGYVMVNEPTAPAMNLYPFGYPLLLATVLKLTGTVATPMQAIVPLKLVSVLFYLACLPVWFVYVRRRHGDLPALLTTALFAANPAVLSLATDILSETPFVFFTLLGLLLIDGYDRTRIDTEREQIDADQEHSFFHDHPFIFRVDPRSVPQVAILVTTALALAAAYYMRTAELAILAAVPLFLLLRRRIVAGLATGAFLAALALPWFLRSSAPPTPETPFFARSYVSQVLADAPYSDQTVSVLGLAERVVNNSWAYLGHILPETIFPHLPSLGSVAPLVSTAIAVLLVLGFALELKRGLRAGEVAVAAYWLSLSLFVWLLGFRYVILVIPFALLYLLVAVHWLAGLVSRTRVNTERERMSADKGQGSFPGHPCALRADPRSATLMLITGLLLVSSLAVGARRVERNLLTTRRQTLAQTYAGNAEWTYYLDAVTWIKQNTPAQAVVMARKPELVYLLSGHSSVEYPYTQSASVLASTISKNRVSYILEDAFTWTRTTETYLVPAMSGLPSAFVLSNESPAPRTRVWQILPTR